MRSSDRSDIVPEKLLTQFRPAAFASYIAISAFLTSVSLSSPSSGYTAIPMLLNFRKQNHEFIAAKSSDVYIRIRPAKPSDEIRFAQATREPCGDAFEKFVTDGVPEGIVDPLEVIEINVKNSHVAIIAARPIDGFRYLNQERLSIWQTGQRVVEGQPMDLGIRTLLLGYIAQDY
jgi:hypothetical protein